VLFAMVAIDSRTALPSVPNERMIPTVNLF
jgi:hypothetical protein